MNFGTEVKELTKLIVTHADDLGRWQDIQRKWRSKAEQDISALNDRVAALSAPKHLSMVTPDQRKFRSALTVYARRGDMTELKTLATDTGPDGEYMVLPNYSPTMTTKLWDVSPMRRVCRIEEVSKGESFYELIDNGQGDVAWRGQREVRAVGNTPQLGRLDIPLCELEMLQPITQWMLDDAMFDAGAWLDTKITTKMARAQGAAFVSGDGIKQPKGLLTYPTSSASDATRPWGTLRTIKTGSASGITADALHTIVWSLRIPYRPGAIWMMNSNTASQIDQFRDSVTGRYLWRESLVQGMPPTLLGYPVILNEDFPDLAGGSLSIAFGNFNLAYLIVDRVGVNFLRDIYSNKPNTLFWARQRVGGAVANSEAVVLALTSA